MKTTTVQNINTLSAFCGKRDLNALETANLKQKYGIEQADVLVLFGGSILAGGDLLAQAIKNNLAKKYIIVGGYGHTTDGLRKEIQKHLSDSLPVNRLSEAELFNEYLKSTYGLQADYLETKSTNCGNNITYLLELIKKETIPHQSIILIQDAAMQLRMDATFKKFDTHSIVINYAAYQAQVKSRNLQLEYTQEISGMWPIERYISLLMGEIPRLADDENGYGPNGKNYLAHVEVPKEVTYAFLALQQVFPDAVRVANPAYSSKQ
ncbi:YdcF family protein [uncultured Enterococcus sp.]|uniref:YdcF family protein n=1 Tax=uncultured Enterococcus sp. TaxID=167972 RepID=UPI002AA90B6F|nr:YdcF family protein [uncultured Enterococcus sp.]